MKEDDLLMMVKRNLFVSYQFAINRDNTGHPAEVGYGNRIMHMFGHEMRDEDDVRELESQIEAALRQEMETEDAVVILLNYNWMGD